MNPAERKTSSQIILEKISSQEIAGHKNYVYLSFVQEDSDNAYYILEKLLRSGIPVIINDMTSLSNRRRIVLDKRCRAMIILMSRSYLDSKTGLIEQYLRFCTRTEENSENKHQVPCLLIDLQNDRCSYKNQIDPENVEISGSEKLSAAEKDIVKEGLKGLFGTSEGIYGKLIERSLSDLDSGQRGSFRRQMSFILDYDGHLDNVTNLEDTTNCWSNLVGKIKKHEIEIDEDLKEISTLHFNEWGKEKYSLNQDNLKAEIVCSKEEIYIKKGSLINENPAKDRSGNSDLKQLYKELLLSGDIKLSKVPGKLEAARNIKDSRISSIEDIHLFITGSRSIQCTNLWINTNTGEPYRNIME